MSRLNLLLEGFFIAQIFGLVIYSHFVHGQCNIKMSTPVGTPDKEHLVDLRTFLFHGTPTFFEVSSYIVNNTQRQITDSHKFYCGEMPYPDERKYLCLRRRIGRIEVRNGAQFWQVYARTFFEIIVKVRGSSGPIGLCVIKIVVGANSSLDFIGTTAATTKSTTTPSTEKVSSTAKTAENKPNITRTTTKMSTTTSGTMSLSSSSSPRTTQTSTIVPTTDPCTSAKYIASLITHQCKPINMKLYPKYDSIFTNFEIESGPYLKKVSYIVIKNISYIVGNKLLHMKLYAVTGLSNELLKDVKIKYIKQGQKVAIDVFLSKNSSALSLEILIANQRISTSAITVNVLLSSYELCKMPHCISLYNVWMRNFTSGYCANNMTNSPVQQFSTCFDMCKSEDTIMPSTSVKYNWPRTQRGTTVELPCKNGVGFAKRTCVSRNNKAPVWGQVMDTDCKSVEKKRDDGLNKLQNAKISAANASEAAEELKNLTISNPASLPPTQLVKITDILEQLSAFARDEKVAYQMLDTVDNCMQASDKSFLEGEQSSNMSSRMVSVLSTVCSAMVEEKSEFKAVKKGFALAGVKENKTSFQGITLSYQATSSSSSQASISLEKSARSKSNDSSTSLVLPADLLVNNQIEALAFLFIAYDSGKLFQEKGRNRLNSKIISAEVRSQKISGLKHPIVTKFKNSNSSSAEKLCAWWDFKLQGGRGGWSQSGCQVHKVENGYTTCHCNHLTNFAVLLGAEAPVKGSTHEIALSIVSYIGVAISLAGVLFTLLSYTIFPKLRENHPPKILMNLCASLALLLIIYAAGVERTKPREGCQTVAFLLQYSILSVLAWSAVEGFNSYRGIVKPMKSEIPKLLRKAAVVGWGVPVIFPIIGISAWTDSYGDRYSCVVRGLPLYTTLIAPVGIVMLFNLVAIFCILAALNKSSKMYSHNAIKMLHRVRIIVAFVLLFSLTWLFGFLVVSSNTVALQYIFCILNSFQGFFIFLFYCVRNENVRKSWKEKFVAERPKLTSSVPTKKTDSSFDSAIYTKTDSLKSDYSVNKNGSIDSSTKIQLTSRANIYSTA